MGSKSKRRGAAAEETTETLGRLSERIKAARLSRGGGKHFLVTTPEVDSWLSLALKLERRVAELEAAAEKR